MESENLDPRELVELLSRLEMEKAYKAYREDSTPESRAEYLRALGDFADLIMNRRERP
jgi:hypothetical protein